MSVGWVLDDASTEALLKLPETGMGFQFVEATVQGVRKPFLVFNAETSYDVSDPQLTDSNDPASILLNGTRIVHAIVQAAMMPGNLSLSSITIAAPRITASAGGPAAPSTDPLVSADKRVVKVRIRLESSARVERLSGSQVDGTEVFTARIRVASTIIAQSIRRVI